MDSVSNTSPIPSQKATENVLPRHSFHWSGVAIVLGVALFSGLLFGFIGYTIGLSHMPLNTVQVQSQMVKKELPPLPSTPMTAFKIVGLYELADSVVYVSDTPSYSNFYFWFNPQLKNTSYGDGKLVEHTQATMQKGEGYQFVVYNQNITDGVTSDKYIFAGNRTIIQDPRCPQQVHTSNSSMVTSAVCTDTTTCIKDITFIASTCPMTQIITPTPTPMPSLTASPQLTVPAM